MNHATFERKNLFFWTAVIFVLLNGIFYILFGQLILKLESNYRQTIDEYAKIKSQFSCIDRVAKLSCNAEYILGIKRLRRIIIFIRCQIEHNEVSWIHLDSVAKNIDDSTFGKFTLEAIQECSLFLLTLKDCQLFYLIRLSVSKEAEKACFVYSILFVVVCICTLLVAIMLNKPINDYCF